MKIRRAQAKDIKTILSLLQQVLELHAAIRPDIFVSGTTKYTEEELGTMIRDDEKPVFVAADEADAVLGYAFCIYQETKENGSLHARRTLYLDDLCVDAQARGRHIGAELYRHVLKTAKETGCDSVTLNVWAVNGEAAAFYERMGMKPLKTTMETIL